MNTEIVDNYCYTNRIDAMAYGGGFLCTSELFNKVKFRQGILEDASGFDIARTKGVKCLKTWNIQHFWIEHLSHRLK